MHISAILLYLCDNIVTLPVAVIEIGLFNLDSERQIISIFITI